MGVVEPLDIVEDGRSGLSPRPEDVPIEQLAFERGEEGLGHGIVEAVAAAAEGRHHACLLAAIPEGEARILTAMIGVMDDAGGRATIR